MDCMMLWNARGWFSEKKKSSAASVVRISGPFSSACGMSLASELKDAGVDKKVAEVFVKTTASVELFLATFRRALALRLVPQIFGFVCVQV